MAFRILDLPAELQTSISNHAAASTALALSRTCKTLRANVYMIHVFREILKNSRWPLDTFRIADILSIEDLQLLIGFALADEKAHELWNGVEDAAVTEKVTKAMSWMPQLVLYQHPIMTSRWLALRLSELVHGSVLEMPVAFCFAASMMSIDNIGKDMIDASALLKSVNLKQHSTEMKAVRAIGVFALLLRQEMDLSREPVYVSWRLSVSHDMPHTETSLQMSKWPSLGLDGCAVIRLFHRSTTQDTSPRSHVPGLSL